VGIARFCNQTFADWGSKNSEQVSDCLSFCISLRFDAWNPPIPEREHETFGYRVSPSQRFCKITGHVLALLKYQSLHMVAQVKIGQEREEAFFAVVDISLK
jgi:hypothetical protein